MRMYWLLNIGVWVFCPVMYGCSTLVFAAATLWIAQLQYKKPFNSIASFDHNKKTGSI